MNNKLQRFWYIYLFIVVVLSFMLFSCGGGKQPSGKPLPPVEVIKIKAQEIPVYTEFVGQIYGKSDIAIRARVEGFLESIHFTEGSTVRKGQLLYTIDPQPFEATVAARMSNVAAAKTQLVKAENDLNRIRPLAEKNAVSQSDLDAAVANFEAAKASVEAANANLEAAQIQLGYTRIYSPVKGIIGLSEARVGDFVGRSPNPVVLNEVSDIDTILVRFSLSESDYLRMSRFIASLDSLKRKQHMASKQEADKQIALILADGESYPYSGKLDFVDRNVDPTTGSIMVQASFPNPHKLLRPGMFAKIKAKVENLENAIKVPQRCVTELQGIHQVSIVQPDSTILVKDVIAGAKVGSDWIIKSGLKAGETIIYEGLQKIRNGMKVAPVPAKINNSDQQ